jgi:hypothetical protein
MARAYMFAGVQERFSKANPSVVMAVGVLTITVATAVGVLTPHWYAGVIAFWALAAGVMVVIDQWPQLYRLFSIDDEEAENAQITQTLLSNRLKIEEEQGAADNAQRATHLKLCREELEAAGQDLQAQRFDLAWSRFHFVEEMLLLLAPKEEVIAQLEIIAMRAQELPDGKRDEVIKVLTQARDLLQQDPALTAPKETAFRTALKEALAAINYHRRLFHWYRGIYQAQIYVLLTAMAPLLSAFLVLQWRLPPELSARPTPFLPFLGQIFILGAIGGVVSLLLNERNLGEGVTSFYYGKIGLLIKPALGAVGAVVVYYLFDSNLLFQIGENATTSAGVVKLSVSYGSFYYVLAFLSGFSERFFTATVARLEGRLSETGKA